MSNTKKKGITVPKPKTVSMRKYSELKTRYSTLYDDHIKLEMENKDLKEFNDRQARELKLQEQKSGDVCIALVNEFKVAEEVVNKLNNLNPFARRVALRTVLTSLIEQAKYDVAKNEEKLQDATTMTARATSNMEDLAEVISST